MQIQHSSTDDYLAVLPQWQQDNLRLFRTIIHDVLPDVDEQIKWGVPTFFNGKTMLFAMAAFKAHTKFNFIYNGAKLKDKDRLFNNGFESSKGRGIDMREGEPIDKEHLVLLVKQSVDTSL